MQTELNENKVLSMLKTVPGVQAILRQAEEKEALYASRGADVAEYLSLRKAKREADLRRDVEAAKNSAKIKQCLDALDLAKKEGTKLNLKYDTERHKYQTRLGELEGRLRLSAPEAWLARLSAIQTEIDDLTNKKFLSTTAHLDGRISNPEMTEARQRVNELIQERDQINRDILEKEGGNEE